MEKIRHIPSKIIYTLTGHSLANLSTFDDLVAFLHRPVDSASLCVCRMLFGFVMMLDIPEERGGASMFEKWDNPRLCHFPIMSRVTSMDATKMGVVYGIMWIGALGIFLGYRFRWACAMFSVSYWYIFLVDRSVWNNHSYLYGLCGILFWCSSANCYCSIDSWMATVQANTVPFWNYFIVKFQFFILYFVAGLKKTSMEWLSGFAMSNLSHHWVFAPFRYTLGTALTDLLVVHWFTCFFDLTIAVWMIYRPTRPLATIFCVAFHLMNSNLFSIGMFPWLCLTQLPLFYERNWPRIWITSVDHMSGDIQSLVSVNELDRIKVKRNENQGNTFSSAVGFRKRIHTLIIMVYCTSQIVLPYSHFITRGFNTWTDGPYGYSWDMMIHAWDTVRVSVKVRDNVSQQEHFLNPKEFAYSDRWTKHADMAHQFAQCIADQLIEEFRTSEQSTAKSPLTSTNISIFFDVWCSLNGRFQQRIFNPNVDILTATWTPWSSTPWVLPLISHVAPDRTEMQTISEALHRENHSSDLLFVSDYPGLSVEHVVPEDLENVTLTILQGEIELSQKPLAGISVKRGLSVPIETGCVHKIRTIGTEPSGLLYTFSNRTIANSPNTREGHQSVANYVRTGIMKRFQKYHNFIRNVVYSVSHEIIQI